MSRKALTAPESDDIRAMDFVVRKQEEVEKSRKDSFEKALQVFGGGRAFDLLQFEEEYVFFLRNSVESSFEAGCRLIIIKEFLGHGGFLASLERRNVSPRDAAYCMAIAKKFIGYKHQFEDLGKSKLILLSSLDDEEIKELAEGEEVYGQTLDSIGNMTTRELRTALREAKQKLAQKEETIESIIRQKNSKIDELEIKLSGQEPPTKAQLAEARLRKEIDPVFFQKLLAATHQIRECTRLIEEAQKIEGITFDALDAWTRLNNEYLASFTDVFEEFNDVYENIHVDRSRDGEEDGV